MTSPNATVADPFARVLGDELRKARKARGWTRKQLAARLPIDVSLQTLATYELGTRKISVERLYELCQTMNVFAHDLLARVHARLSGRDAAGRLVLDLRLVLADEQPELFPLRRWAGERLAPDHPTGPAELALDFSALERLAELCGLQVHDLIVRLDDLTAADAEPLAAPPKAS